METNTYVTRRDAIQREIIEVLDASDGDIGSDDFDVDAIADEVLGTIGEGVTYRYVVAVDEDAFWASVMRHDLSECDDTQVM